MRRNPAVLLGGAFVVYVPVVINMSGCCDWLGEAIYAFVPLSAAACLSCEVIATMSHERADLASKSWIVLWEFCFYNVVDEVDG
jgi:hypothetical protein